MDKSLMKIKSMLSGRVCNHCGAEANSSSCCLTGSKHYMFEWVGGGFNQTHADSADEAYQKVLIQTEGSKLIPIKSSFRLFDSKEYDKLISYWD